MSYRNGIAPNPFRYVTATPEEVAEYIAKNDRRPTQYRLQCKICNARIWGSGIGIGAHRRSDAHTNAFFANLREAQG